MIHVKDIRFLPKSKVWSSWTSWVYVNIYIYTLEVKDYENNSPQFLMIKVPYLKIVFGEHTFF